MISFVDAPRNFATVRRGPCYGRPLTVGSDCAIPARSSADLVHMLDTVVREITMDRLELGVFVQVTLCPAFKSIPTFDTQTHAALAIA